MNRETVQFRRKRLDESDPLQTYYKEAFDTEFVKGNEYESLFGKIVAGDEGARERMIRAHLPLVIRIACEYSGDPSERIQYGSLALLEAVDYFDPERGKNFPKFAEKYFIRPAMTRAYRSENHTFHVPDWAFQITGKVRTAQHELQSEGKEGTMEEAGRAMGMKRGKLKRLPQIIEGTERVKKKGEVTEFMRAVDGIPTRHAILHDEQRRVHEAIQMLMFRHRNILRGVYGIDGDKKPEVQIGVELHLSRESIRQEKLKAMEALRNILAGNDSIDPDRVRQTTTTDERVSRARTRIAKDLWSNTERFLNTRNGLPPTQQEIASYLGVDLDIKSDDPEAVKGIQLGMLYEKILRVFDQTVGDTRRQDIMRGLYCLRGSHIKLTASDLAKRKNSLLRNIFKQKYRSIIALRNALSPEERERKATLIRTSLTQTIWEQAGQNIREKEGSVTDERIAAYFHLANQHLDDGETLREMQAGTLLSLVEQALPHLSPKDATLLKDRFCIGGNSKPRSRRETAEKIGVPPVKVWSHTQSAIRRLVAYLSPEEGKLELQRIRRSLAERIWEHAKQTLANGGAKPVTDSMIAAHFGFSPEVSPLQAQEALVQKLLSLPPDALEEKVRRFINMRFCIGPNEKLTERKEIARELGSHKASISNLLKSCVGKIHLLLSPAQQEAKEEKIREGMGVLIWEIAKRIIQEREGGEADPKRIARHFGMPEEEVVNIPALHSLLAVKATELLDDCSEGDREILRERYLDIKTEQPSFTVIGEKRGLSETTAKARVYKALELLRRKLSVEEESVAAESAREQLFTLLSERLLAHIPKTVDAPAAIITSLQLLPNDETGDISKVRDALIYRIEQLLDTVPKRAATLLRERFCLDGHSEVTGYEELAQRFDCRKATLAQCVARTLNTLAKRLLQ